MAYAFLAALFAYLVMKVITVLNVYLALSPYLKFVSLVIILVQLAQSQLVIVILVLLVSIMMGPVHVQNVWDARYVTPILEIA